MSDVAERQFPILGAKDAPRSIPWRVLAPHEKQAQRNHSQSLESLARRGGLCWSEAYGVLKGIGWSRLPRGQEEACKRAVLAIVAAQEPRA